MLKSMNKETDGYLSVFGTALLQSIVDLWEKLEEKPEKRPNQVQTNVVENGLAIAIIILTMAVVESLLNRTRYIMHCRNIHNIPEKEKESLVSFFRLRFKKRGLANRLEELYVIRDVILHNHIWDAEVHREGKLTFTKPPILVLGHGDKKFKKVLNINNRCSKILRLNLFPTRISRRDARKVLRVAYDILYSVESVDQNYCVVSWMSVIYMKKGMEFSEFILRISGEYSDPIPIAELAPE